MQIHGLWIQDNANVISEKYSTLIRLVKFNNVMLWLNRSSVFHLYCFTDIWIKNNQCSRSKLSWPLTSYSQKTLPSAVVYPRKWIVGLHETSSWSKYKVLCLISFDFIIVMNHKLETSQPEWHIKQLHIQQPSKSLVVGLLLNSHVTLKSLFIR